MRVAAEKRNAREQVRLASQPDVCLFRTNRVLNLKLRLKKKPSHSDFAGPGLVHRVLCDVSHAQTSSRKSARLNAAPSRRTNTEPKKLAPKQGTLHKLPSCSIPFVSTNRKFRVFTLRIRCGTITSIRLGIENSGFRPLLTSANTS